jgi:nitrate/nitrite transporter NarK
MGYTANQAQLMSVPPYVVACFFTIVASYLADMFKTRGIFMMGFQLVAITGFAMLAGSGNSHIQYAGTVLAAVGMCNYASLFITTILPNCRHLPSNSPRSCMERK